MHAIHDPCVDPSRPTKVTVAPEERGGGGGAEAVEEGRRARRQEPRRSRGVGLEEVHEEIRVPGAAAVGGVQMVAAEVRRLDNILEYSNRLAYDTYFTPYFRSRDRKAK